MFENLQSRFQTIFRNLTGRGRLDEKSIKEALREVRLAFLEADVNYKATREFCDRIEKRAMGVEILRSLTPAQQVIKIVKEEMVVLLGGNGRKTAIVSRSGSTNYAGGFARIR